MGQESKHTTKDGLQIYNKRGPKNRLFKVTRIDGQLFWCGGPISNSDRILILHARREDSEHIYVDSTFTVTDQEWKQLFSRSFR